MQVGHFTWSVLHFQCMYHHSGIHRSGMDPIQIDNFCPCNLYEKKPKKNNSKMRDAFSRVEKRVYMLLLQLQQHNCC